MFRQPRSGPWLIYIKIVFGTTMIAMALYFMYPIVKPLFFERSAGLTGSRVATCPQGDGIAGDEGGDSLACAVGGSPEYATPQWKLYSLERLAQAKGEKRPVIIDFKAEWCAACKELEKYTFSDPRVLANKNLVWLEFDATEGSPELDELKKRYGILGLPFVTFYDSTGEWRQDLTLTGFENADAFLERLQRLK